jgi:indoleamine 2,3-dioxygenase
VDWHLHELGFLPMHDPAAHLGQPEFQPAERLGADLPRLIHERSFRTASADYLTAPLDWEALLPSLNGHEVEHLFLRWCYFASAFVHSPGLPAAERLPAHIAVPLDRLARAVGRPPILAYASYCLHNWQRHDPTGPVALGNIRLLQNFSLPGDGKEDEDWFILVHVDIEARAGAALRAVRSAEPVMARDDPEAMEALLETTAAALREMNQTMNRMPEGCRPEVYFRKVRPYIFGFTNVVYEGCADTAPRTYRGETGAQSSIVPTLLAALGVRHRDSLLTTHLEDMRNYMPPPHRQFIREQPSVREYVARLVSAGTGTGRKLRELYNECLHELITFRSRHFEYAVNYIEKRVDNPLGTGGTPYIPWLRQLIEETREHFL